MVDVEAFNSSDFILDYPTRFTKNNRVMGLLLSYDLNHLDPVVLILNEYVSMCEGGWEPTLVFFTSAFWTDKLRR
jgi:hypothetical protein